MIPIRSHYKIVVISLAAILLMIFCWPVAAAASENPADDAALLASICPVVYPLDQFPTERGYRYFFFGNAFFINEEGYLVTAAHVVKSFRDGGRPYILVGTLSGPRRLQEAELVAVDWEHDVAVLRATPNPFVGQHHVAFLSMTAERPSVGKPVMAVSVLPSDLHDSHTSEAPIEIRSQGQVIDYQFHAESTAADSELLLFNQKIVPGQSGSPVLSADSREVVGIVVGQWLHPTIIHFATTAQPVVTSPGAVLRIHYAMALLRRQGITWHAASALAAPTSPAPQASGFSSPVPISLVATPYPAQALLGGEVVLDALIDTNGRIAGLNVVHGTAPFLEPVLNAVRTWTFSPAQMDGRVVEARIGIVVQFPQSFLPKLTARERKYDRPSEDSVGHGALPVSTVEPDYPPNTVAEDSVILYNLVNQQGQVTSTRVLRDVEPLTTATLAASQQWRFVPGTEAGTNTDSAVALVVTFRHP
jgi:Trypsin-like peptidase domain/Gram-negative bacterial TonB protein C-terminal